MPISDERLAQLVAALKLSPWIEQLCPVQRRVYYSPSRWKSVTTSRRGGKTILLVALATDALEQCARGEVVLCISQTRGSAKELFWDKLQAVSDMYKLGWTFHVSDLRIETPRGGVLLVRGAEGSDAVKERRKIRGLKCRRVLLDETQNYASTLKTLLRDVIEPSLGDLRGDLIVAGTPGEVMAGGWYNVSAGKHPGSEAKWERFHWTVRENTYFRDAEEYLAQARVDNNWTEDDPTYQREYEGRWQADESVQVAKYLASRNDVLVVPGYDVGSWVHSIGVDFGIKDDCAWVVLASHPHEQTAYCIHAEQHEGIRPDESADITAKLVAKYQPDVLVGDGWNLGGNLYIEAINERLGERASARMIPAQKAEKRAYIELMNGDLRSAKLLFLQPATEGLTEEMKVLPWANTTRQKIHPNHKDHLFSGLLYCWRHHSAYLHSVPVVRRDPVQGEAGYQEWLLERDAEQHRTLCERPWWE